MDVEQGHGEDQPARQSSEPAHQAGAGPERPTADDVVAVLDRLEQWREVLRGPRLDGGRHQHQRQPGAGQADLQSAIQSAVGGRDDPGLHDPAGLGQVSFERLDNGARLVRGRVGEQDNADARVGQRIALEVAEKRIVGILDHWPSAVRS